VSNSSQAVGHTGAPGKRPHSKVLVDGSDPEETAQIKQLIGFVDGPKLSRSDRKYQTHVR